MSATDWSCITATCRWLLPAAGESVTAGSVIGNVLGSTGNHLHLEFRQDGAPEDPVPVLSAHGVSL
jgi:murein DD-endopeptidase MepM/ murein hydrolase activator NlpD